MHFGLLKPGIKRNTHQESIKIIFIQIKTDKSIKEMILWTITLPTDKKIKDGNL